VPSSNRAGDPPTRDAAPGVTVVEVATAAPVTTDPMTTGSVTTGGTGAPASHTGRLRQRVGVLAAISAGGGCGGLARYLIDQALPVAPGHLPWATLIVNVAGCLALGALNVFLLEVWPPRRYVRPLCGIGLLGGFTTFSTYTAEVRDLLGRGAVPLAAGYALAGLAAGLAATWAGIAAARLLSSARDAA
jgi:CrcB protein